MRCERRAGVLGLPGVSRARCVPLDPGCWVALQPTQPNPTQPSPPGEPCTPHSTSGQFPGCTAPGTPREWMGRAVQSHPDCDPLELCVDPLGGLGAAARPDPVSSTLI